MAMIAAASALVTQIVVVTPSPGSKMSNGAPMGRLYHSMAIVTMVLEQLCATPERGTSDRLRAAGGMRAQIQTGPRRVPHPLMLI